MTAIKPTTISELLQPLRDAEAGAQREQFNKESELLAARLLQLLPGVPFEVHSHEKFKGHPIAIIRDGEDEEGTERIYKFTLHYVELNLVRILFCHKCLTQIASYVIHQLNDLYSAIEHGYSPHSCEGRQTPAEELANAVRNVIGQE